MKFASVDEEYTWEIIYLLFECIDEEIITPENRYHK